jgi:hypothetical protein
MRNLKILFFYGKFGNTITVRGLWKYYYSMRNLEIIQIYEEFKIQLDYVDFGSTITVWGLGYTIKV